MTEFTPIPAILGGALIGASAVALMAFNGRIAGLTGILSGAMLPGAGGRGWRLAFLAGAILAPALMWLALGAPVPFASDLPAWAVILSGLLVGVGVTYGGGCTSGHGVCGIARLSPRSIAATVVFMAFSGATVFVVRHVLGVA
ncbi:YeeE/YedE family protein [Devosia sp. ZB163]|uniref:YeeE/YedE family protein n=1 Tax=Devosia sp. ZB163 TaxID=3025938 RepID=UPI0023607A09|nr:YeeE/YedE family protein [Devosia sp. ZB163]MDC9823691.1 YeeE/YedE family protein [Devosia sp. ZB163]